MAYVVNETQGALLMQAGPGADGSNPAASVLLSDSIEVRSGRGDLPLPPNLTSNAYAGFEEQTGVAVQFGVDASSLFDAQAEWSQAFQGFSDEPGSTAWISAQGTYDTQTGAPSGTGAVTTVLIPGTGGTTIDVAGEWLQLTTSPAVYASRFSVAATNPNYVPDAIQLLGSTDGGATFVAIGSPSSQAIGQAPALLSGATYAIGASAAARQAFDVFRLVVTKVSVTPGFQAFADVAQIDIFKIYGNTRGSVAETLFAVDSNSLVVTRRGFVGIGLRDAPAPSAPLHIGNTTAATGGRTLVVWDKVPDAPDEVHYRGWGVSNDALIHRVDDAASAHIFVAANRELVRMRGDGLVRVPDDGELNVLGVFSHCNGPVLAVDGGASLPPGATTDGLFVRPGTGYVGIGTSNPQAPLDVAASPVVIRGCARFSSSAGECNVLTGGAGAGTVAADPLTCLADLGACNDVRIGTTLLLRDIGGGQGAFLAPTTSAVVATSNANAGGMLVFGVSGLAPGPPGSPGFPATPDPMATTASNHAMRIHAPTRRVAVATGDDAPRTWDGLSAIVPDPYALDVGQGVRVRQGGVSFPSGDAVGMNVCLAAALSNSSNTPYDSALTSMGAGYGAVTAFDPATGEMTMRVSRAAATAAGQRFGSDPALLFPPALSGKAQLAVVPKAVRVGDGTPLVVGKSIYNLDFGSVAGDDAAHWFRVAGFAGAAIGHPVYLHARGVCGAQARPIAVDMRYVFGVGGTSLQHCRLINDGTLLFARLYLCRHPVSGDVTLYLRLAAPAGSGTRAVVAKFDVEASGDAVLPIPLNGPASLTAELTGYDPLVSEIVVWDCFADYTELVDPQSGTLSVSGSVACGAVVAPVRSSLPGAPMALTAPLISSYDDDSTRMRIWSPSPSNGSGFSWAAYLGAVTSNAVREGGAPSVAICGAPGGGLYFTSPLDPPPPEADYDTTLCGFSPSWPGQSNIVQSVGASNFLFDLYTLGGQTGRSYVLGDTQHVAETWELLSGWVVAPGPTDLDPLTPTPRDAVVRARVWDWAQGHGANEAGRAFLEMRVDCSSTPQAATDPVGRLTTDGALVLSSGHSSSSQSSSSSSNLCTVVLAKDAPVVTLVDRLAVGRSATVGATVDDSAASLSVPGAGCATLVLGGANGGLAPSADAVADCGRSDARWRALYAANGVVQTSDSSEKHTRALPYGLSELERVRTVVYRWRDARRDAEGHEFYGVCADELVDVFPELVYEDPDGQAPCQLNYSELVPVLINAVRELSDKVRALERLQQGV